MHKPTTETGAGNQVSLLCHEYLYWAAVGSYFLICCLLGFVHPSCCSLILGIWSQVTN